MYGREEFGDYNLKGPKCKGCEGIGKISII